MAKVWLSLLDLIDFVVVVWPIMVCHPGQLAAIHGPYVFLAKSELYTSSMKLADLGGHPSSTLFSIFGAGGSMCYSCDVIEQLMS